MTEIAPKLSERTQKSRKRENDLLGLRHGFGGHANVPSVQTCAQRCIQRKKASRQVGQH